MIKFPPIRFAQKEVSKEYDAERMDVLNLEKGNHLKDENITGFNALLEGHNIDVDLTDEHGNKITRAQARRADRMEELDRQTEIVQQIIKSDKNYKHLVILEKEEQRRRGGITQFIKQQIADFLVPPATRPAYEREQEELRKEQIAIMKKKKENIFRMDQGAKEPDMGKVPKSEVLSAPDFVLKHKSTGNVTLLHRSEKCNIINEGRFGMLENYCGYRFQGTRQGKGVQVFEDGARYDGFWVNGFQEGFGQMRFKSGDVYAGQWSLGLQHGLGIFRSIKGNTYRGYWSKGLRDGYGEISDSMNRIVFRGEWRAGKKHGSGIKIKFGVTFFGEWVDDQKDGDGILRSEIVQIGVGKFFTKWRKGKLVSKEAYDALGHGMDVLNCARWAGHYAAAAAQDASTVVRYEMAYPHVPRRQKDKSSTTKSVGSLDGLDDAESARADSRLTPAGEIMQASELPEHLIRFKESWLTCRSALPYSEMIGDSTSRQILPNSCKVESHHEDHQQSQDTSPAAESSSPKHVTPPNDSNEAEVKRCQVPVRELRRLISLVHSADKTVEDLVLPILNDAIQVSDCSAGEEVFLVGPVWDKNLNLLNIHFAIKIQRKWRKLLWKRAFRAARVTIEDGKQDEIKSKAAKDAKLELAYNHESRERERCLVEKVSKLSLSSKFTILAEQGECSSAIVELFKKSKVLFGLEMQTLCEQETSDRWVLYNDESIHSKSAVTDLTNANSKSFKSQTSQSASDPSAVNSDDVDVTIGKLITGNGIVYYGQIGNRFPHGFGTARYPDGSMYAGQFSLGMRHGVGEYVRQVEDGDRHLEFLYLGEWLENKRHGFAIEQKKSVGLVDELLSSTLVEYKNDEALSSLPAEEEGSKEWLAQCQEVSSWARRAADEAQALSHEKKKSKQSSLKLSNLYEFSFTEGLTSFYGSFDELGRRHGPGVLELCGSWQRFAGDWNQNVFEGFGREDTPDQACYLGQFQNGQRHGRGKIEFESDGTISSYSGEWKLGMRDGRGIEKKEKKSGRTREVEWVATVHYNDDVLVDLDNFNAAKMGHFLEEVETAVRSGSRYF